MFSKHLRRYEHGEFDSVRQSATRLTVRGASLFAALGAACVSGPTAVTPPKPAVPVSSVRSAADSLDRYLAALTESPPSQRGLEEPHLTVSGADGVGLWVNSGLALVHAFEEYEAARAFREALRLDSTASLAWWGLAQSLQHLPELRSEALARALRHAPPGTDRARLYVEITLQSDSAEERRPAARSRWDSLAASDDTDVEARLQALQLVPIGERAERLRRIRDMLRQYPRHLAGHHYWLHAHEGGASVEAALASAELIERRNPRAPHLTHMPGHIYYRIGQYERARRTFKRADVAEGERLQRGTIPLGAAWNFAHNLSYLSVASARTGRFGESHNALRALHRLPAATAPHRGVGPRAPWYSYWFFGLWSEASARPEAFSAGSGPQAGRDSLVVAVHRGYATVRATLDRQQRDSAGAALARVRSAMGPTPASATGTRRSLDVLLRELDALVASADRDHEQAIVAARAAVAMADSLGYREPPLMGRPPIYTLGEVLLAAGQWRQAESLYRTMLRDAPEDGLAAFGIAQSLERGGRLDEARAAYAQFQSVWEHADDSLPQIRHAQRASLPRHEARIRYLGISGWLLQHRDAALVIDFVGQDSTGQPTADLGVLPPASLVNQRLTVIATHGHSDHYAPTLPAWSDAARADLVFLGHDIASASPRIALPPDSTVRRGGVVVHTARSTDEGVAVLIQWEGLELFHAGDHALWSAESDSLYRAGIDRLALRSPDGVDIAFLPIATGLRCEVRESLRDGARYAIERLKPRLVAPMHVRCRSRLDEYRNFAEEFGRAYSDVRVVSSTTGEFRYSALGPNR